MNRGRLAALLDVYTGAPLFVAKYDTATSASQQSKAMRFGFPPREHWWITERETASSRTGSSTPA